MSDTSSTSESSLRIVHVLRSPLGGLFRHVLDLAQGQADRGHSVGLIADSTTGGPRADQLLAAAGPRLTLGVHRLPMHRDPHFSDALALGRVTAITRAMRPDIVHGHGSKGALYARLPGVVQGRRAVPARVYTPHGGSLHFAPDSWKGALVLRIERLLARQSDLILFESAFAADRFREAIGPAPCLTRTVLNGVAPAEFVPVTPDADATDFLYVGELRALKGVDILLDALAAASADTGRRLRATLVGSGADRAAFEEQARRLGLGEQVVFADPQPARQAFRRGRTLVVPSRAESLPYIVLEAAAARVPLIATGVGGIPEIFGPYRDRLIPGNETAALREAMVHDLATTPDARTAAARQLAAHVSAHFSVRRMVDGVLGGYRDALAARAAASPAGSRSPRLRPHRLGL